MNILIVLVIDKVNYYNSIYLVDCNKNIEKLNNTSYTYYRYTYSLMLPLH